MASPVLVFRHVPHEGLGTIAAVLARRRCPVQVIDTPRLNRPLPPPREIAGLILMGGPMAVYERDQYPFLRREIDYLKRVLKTGKPVLGICLGAQLIAHALGARVRPNRDKEIGWYRIQFTPAGKRDPLGGGLASAPLVFQWHGDTFGLPRGARRLATSRLCRNQAFRYQDRVYGLQYHLEVDAPLVREWLSQPGADSELAAVGPRARRQAEERLVQRCAGLARTAGPFFDHFARLCAGPVPPEVKKG